jgi:hypothetical protein
MGRGITMIFVIVWAMASRCNGDNGGRGNWGSERGDVIVFIVGARMGWEVWVAEIGQEFGMGRYGWGKLTEFDGVYAGEDVL